MKRGCPRRSQCSELEDNDQENDQLAVNPELVWDLLLLQNLWKFIGPDGIHQRVVNKSAGEHNTARPLSTIFQQFWESVEVPDDWTLGNAAPVFKEGKDDPGKAGLSVHFSD